MSKDIFSNNPTLDLYYKTSDGTPFFTKNAAQNHAKTLEDKSVNKVTRTSLKTAVLVTDAVSAKDEAKEPKKGKAAKTEQEKEINTPDLVMEGIKEHNAAMARYRELHGVDPDYNLTTKDIELLNEAKANEQPTAPADQVKDEGSTDAGALQDDTIEDSAAEYNQAVSDYKEKFGEAPFEGAELNKIKWAVQFNKKLATS